MSASADFLPGLDQNVRRDCSRHVNRPNPTKVSGMTITRNKVRWPLLLTLVATVALCTAASAPQSEPKVVPSEVRLSDLHARRQLLVSSEGKDVTRLATYQSTDLSIATVDSRGYVAPLAEGSAQIIVTFNGTQIVVPITLASVNPVLPIDFATEVVPLLSRFGCNAGGCHGKASGQNGFKLSLFGFDTRFDYSAIVEEARGRRVFPAAPDRSLLLLKATAQVPHGGGKRIEVDSEPYRRMRQWIEAGMPPASA